MAGAAIPLVVYLLLSVPSLLLFSPTLSPALDKPSSLQPLWSLKLGVYVFYTSNSAHLSRELTLTSPSFLH
jgi:hypothetical protein